MTELELDYVERITNALEAIAGGLCPDPPPSPTTAENAIACAAERQAEMDSVAAALGLAEPLVTVGYVLEAVARLTRERLAAGGLVDAALPLRGWAKNYRHHLSDKNEHGDHATATGWIISDVRAFNTALAAARPEAAERHSDDAKKGAYDGE